MNDRKKLHLGRFISEIEAARAYDRAVLKYRGDFARLNFPREDYKDEIQNMKG
jgi:AP2-like factor (ANT lineage)